MWYLIGLIALYLISKFVETIDKHKEIKNKGGVRVIHNDLINEFLLQGFRIERVELFYVILVWKGHVTRNRICIQRDNSNELIIRLEKSIGIKPVRDLKWNFPLYTNNETILTTVFTALELT